MGRLIFSVLALVTLSLVGCGGNPVEDLQRKWISEEHAVEMRLVAVRAAHIQSRQALTQRARQHGPNDSVAATSRISVRKHDSVIAGLEAMFDRQSQARQSAVDDGDAARMRTALDSARRDYAAADLRIDSIARAISALQRRLAPRGPR